MIESLGLLGQIHVAGGVAGIIFLVGWIWLVVMGFQQKPDWWWGLIALLIPFLGGLVFGIVKWPATKIPLILLIVGAVLGGGAYIPL